MVNASGEIVERWANRAIILLIMAESEYIGWFHWLLCCCCCISRLISLLVYTRCWAPQSVYLCYSLFAPPQFLLLIFFLFPLFLFCFLVCEVGCMLLLLLSILFWMARYYTVYRRFHEFCVVKCFKNIDRTEPNWMHTNTEKQRRLDSIPMFTHIAQSLPI